MKANTITLSIAIFVVMMNLVDTRGECSLRCTDNRVQNGAIIVTQRGNSGKVARSYIDDQLQSHILYLENKGQILDQQGARRDDVLFVGQGSKAAIYIRKNGLSYSIARRRNVSSKNTYADDTDSIDVYRIDMELQGANDHPEVVALDAADAAMNYYGYQYSTPISNVRAYGKIMLKDVYPMIDLVFYGSSIGPKYDYIVRPGGDPSMIRMKYRGTVPDVIQATGALRLATPMGDITEDRPYALQNDTEYVDCNYQVEAGIVSYSIKKILKDRDLRIDPQIIWGTLYSDGGSSANDIVTRSDGSVLITGETISASGIATTGAYQTTLAGSYDAYIAKFDSSGYLVWGTYFGGPGSDQGWRIALASTGDVYVYGSTTSSSGMATPGTHQTLYSDSTDCFLAKFTANGARVWVTYYGGPGEEILYDHIGDLIVDGNNDIIISGLTYSPSGISTAGAHQIAIASPSPDYDGFIAKFSSSGARIWGTYYGGGVSDWVSGVAVDASNNIFIAGTTTSRNGIATPGGYDTTMSSYICGLIAKFTPSGVRVWGTYYGGATCVYFRGIRLVDANTLAVFGKDIGAGGASPGSHQEYEGGGWDAFLLLFTTSGSRIWATKYGGSGTDIAQDVVPVNGDYILFGNTASNDNISTAGSYQPLRASAGINNDMFMVFFTTGGTRKYATYYGGDSDDNIEGASKDGNGNLYLAGNTENSVGITYGNRHKMNGYGGDYAFISKFTSAPLPAAPYITTQALPSSALCVGKTYSISFASSTVMTSGNVFKAQLTDSSGSFINATIIGTLTSTTSGSISITIPAGTKQSSKYRMRVISTKPGILGSDNGTDLLIMPAPSASITPTGPISLCAGDSIVLSASAVNGVSFQWLRNGLALSGATQSQLVVRDSGKYKVAGINGSACSDTSNTVTVQVLSRPTPNMLITGDTVFCTGDSVILVFCN